MSELFTALDTIVLERLPDGFFVVRSGVPNWCRAIRPRVAWDTPLDIADVFPFLDVFLPDAERAWQGDSPEREESGMWAEVDAEGADVHLVAEAVQVRRVPALILTRAERAFAASQTLLQRARELRLTHDTLMKQLEQKDILVHAIVHDLGAPLHSIVGTLSLLGERRDAAPDVKLLEIATQAGTRMRELIGEILDVFAAESGIRGERTLEAVDLSEVVARAISEREPLARMRGIRIERGPEARCRVHADEVRLLRVLTNLLDNAFRYSPEWGVVRVTSRRDDDGVVVAVEDDGPGVPSEVLPRLFEKFSRARDRWSGTGLGLFFCRITVEDWGGGIGYEPRGGRGARFWIRLMTSGPDKRSVRHGAFAPPG